MPLHRAWNPGPQSLAAIWHIAEDEAFFSTETGLTTSIRHPRKRLEHLCGRWLLRYLHEDFPLHQIEPDAHDKPRLPANRYFFSISHSFPYVAAVISETEECGIDIQVWKGSIQSVAHMFLSPEEEQLCRPGNALRRVHEPDARLLTLAWCAKEAAYKWNGRRATDFIEHLPIGQIVGEDWDDILRAEAFRVEMKVAGHAASLPGRLEQDFACAWMLGPRP